MHVHSFPPIESADSRVLILGTMPGKASLRAGQYYANPMNAFWRIAGEILAFDASGAYETRASMLVTAGIALWDVLHSCTRASSLDSDIVSGSIVLNDFETFFASHRSIRRVCFNGAKAESLYMRRVRPLIKNPPECEYVRLPSTSPANASMRFAEKLRAWRVIASNA
jgi:double-stranded uracil-DNA glycosylase